jgi:molybdopterin converting factor small subunit
MRAQIAETLTPEQVTVFNENGYLLVLDAMSQDTVEKLIDDMNKMLNEFSLNNYLITKFLTSSEDSADYVGNAYFLKSRDKVRFFFEEGT